MSYTPLHVLWDGSVAVMVFFVLSGFVLALPFARGRTPNWRAYYPQRLIRLFAPVWGAVVLGSLLIVATPRAASAEVSDWVSGHPDDLRSLGVINDLLLLWQPGHVSSALWSLKWEVLFSLMLPLYLWAARKTRRGLVLKIVALICLLTVGVVLGPADRAYQMGAFFHLPTFAVGVLIAFEWERIERILRGLPVLLTGALWVAALIALSSYWLVFSVDIPFQSEFAGMSRVVQVCGAGLLLVLSARDDHWSRFLNHDWMQWLGSRSFSLYLVHEPLVVVSGNLAALANLPLHFVIPVTMLLALLVSELFFRLIERPSHRFSRLIGRRALDDPRKSIRAKRALN